MTIHPRAAGRDRFRQPCGQSRADRSPWCEVARRRREPAWKQLTKLIMPSLFQFEIRTIHVEVPPRQTPSLFDELKASTAGNEQLRIHAFGRNDRAPNHGNAADVTKCPVTIGRLESADFGANTDRVRGVFDARRGKDPAVDKLYRRADHQSGVRGVCRTGRFACGEYELKDILGKSSKGPWRSCHRSGARRHKAPSQLFSA